jgi:hypothetical protein
MPRDLIFFSCAIAFVRAAQSSTRTRTHGLPERANEIRHDYARRADYLLLVWSQHSSGGLSCCAVCTPGTCRGGGIPCPPCLFIIGRRGTPDLLVPEPPSHGSTMQYKTGSAFSPSTNRMNVYQSHSQGTVRVQSLLRIGSLCRDF